jgi:hypothetical protein
MSDPYYSSVVFLAANESGADATTAFDDAATGNHTITALGNAQWDTAQAPTGQTSSLLCDGTGDAISSATHADFDLGGGDFTIECFARPNALTGNHILYDSRSAGSVGNPVIYCDAAGAAYFFAANGIRITGAAGSIVAAAWQHVAACKSGGTTKLFVGGSQVGTDYADGNTYVQDQIILGQGYVGSAGFNGWLASLRVTKGVARYTVAFTPPSLPFSTAAVTTQIIALIRDRKITSVPGEIEFSIEWTLSVYGEVNGTVMLQQDVSTATDAAVTASLRTQLAAYVSGETGQSFIASDVHGLSYG